MKQVIPVILAGGSGTRLWPLSRESHPKQFLRLIGEHSLLQNTLLRVQGLANIQAPIIICNQEHYFLSMDQQREIGIENAEYILEPKGRNTAPAIALAAILASQRQTKDAVLLIFPADHMIKNNDEEFYKKIQTAVALAEENFLITFGIVPTAPKTGYGYIEAGEKKSDQAFYVKRFVEKPSKDRAENFLSQNNFYWNSGMFAFKASTYLDELKKHAPEIYSACNKTFSDSQFHDNYLRLNTEQFMLCPEDSIDYAVMEKTDRALVLPLEMGWSDLGCWNSVAEAGNQDHDNNTIIGNVIVKETSNSLLSSEERLLCAIGIKDQIIVSTPDAILVAHKNYSQEVKTLVEQLKSENPELTKHHQRVMRPWGYYERLALGPNFQVKHIMVKPGSKLSLQMHKHRAEHWVVVSGEAEIVCGEKVYTLKANESTYIPKETKHRLSNHSKEPLHLIEVQTGSYLGEDDIVRYEDVYGRVSN